ncbi:hypothetical protein Hbl1158_02860 [Halobaculum sp. CBA1158]|uniref:hypothetical protein n=1 Tax=Halobaculum sp. CBA1158 TaxID=2904243 RepID=UPI001F44EE3A|nr:hypothetical protein [Halobaculum sp. CBA1158]UIP00327.1 hypothetical protein Hbl1158_02860 [Halobaculum sp. CBA1158]
MVPIVASLVSLVGLLLFVRALQSPRTRRWLGPAADWWETLRRLVLPLLDRVARERLPGDHFAAYELRPREIVGVIDASPEETERLLWDAGFRRMPLAALKRLPDGRVEIGSWAWRESPLAKRQIHVMLFAAGEGQTLVAAHEEASALNPWAAWDHYRGVGLSAQGGERAVRERLDERVWKEG